jgi:hypothetical protein
MVGIPYEIQQPYDEQGMAPVGGPSSALSEEEHNWLFGPPVASEYGQSGENATPLVSGEPTPLRPAAPVVPGSVAA